MGTTGSRRKAWVRALILVPTALVVFAVLYVISGILIEGNRPGLGDPVAYLDWGTLMLAIFFGPWWVTNALPSTPPKPDGPPKGRIVPLKVRTPGEATPDAGAESSDEAA